MVFKKVTEYDNPELQSQVVLLRDRDNKKWSDIASNIQEEFGLEKTPTTMTMSKVYNKAIATKITIEGKAGKKFDDFSKELNKMYKQTVSVLSKLVDALEKVYEEFETSDMEEMQRYLAFIRLAPQIKSTTDQIITMVKHHEDRQEKIKIEQKNVVYSTAQINEQISTVMKMLINEGYIEVLKKLPFDENNKGGK